jgi:hypothetical protein
MSDIDSLLSDGLDHYLNGRMELAAAAFHEALRLDPGNEQAASYLAAALGVPATDTVPDSFAPLDISGLTAWDEGPQVKENVVVEDDPTVHAPVLDHVTHRFPAKTGKISTESRRQIESLMEEARRFESLGDFSSALEKSERVLALAAAHADAAALRDRASSTLLQMYQSRVGPLDGVPEVIVRQDEMIWLGLDHRAGFVLAQIDGVVNYEELHAVCGMEPLDISRVLAQLLDQKVIRTRPRNTVRPRLR